MALLDDSLFFFKISVPVLRRRAVEDTLPKPAGEKGRLGLSQPRPDKNPA
jgi:hypothetical protein